MLFRVIKRERLIGQPNTQCFPFERPWMFEVHTSLADIGQEYNGNN